MTVADLQRLFDYGHWADRKLFAVMARLTPEQFTRAVDGTHGSIRKTMVHTLSAEWGWLARCGGSPPRGNQLDPTDFPTVPALVEAWDRVEGYGRAFLASLRDEDLTRNVEFTLGDWGRFTMPVGEMLHHAANHGVHHRGQVSLLLRLLGYDLEDFDILLYFAEKGRPAA